MRYLIAIALSLFSTLVFALTSEDRQAVAQFAAYSNGWKTEREVVATHLLENAKVFKLDAKRQSRVIPKVVDTAYRVASDFKVDPLLVLSIITIESSFKQAAYHPAGKSSGYMQVAAINWGTVNCNNVYELNCNLRHGASVLRTMLDRCDDNYDCAALRYNGSLGDRKRTYSRKVLNVYRQLKTAVNHHKSMTNNGTA